MHRRGKLYCSSCLMLRHSQCLKCICCASKRSAVDIAFHKHHVMRCAKRCTEEGSTAQAASCSGTAFHSTEPEFGAGGSFSGTICRPLSLPGSSERARRGRGLGGSVGEFAWPVFLAVGRDTEVCVYRRCYTLFASNA